MAGRRLGEWPLGWAESWGRPLGLGGTNVELGAYFYASQAIGHDFLFDLIQGHIILL